MLKESVVRKQGLIQAISEINQKLNQTEFGNQTDLVYESYVENIGRHLFYIIAESYTTLYLGVIFLVIANTALGTQYLMYQRKTGKRYQTITALGCSYEAFQIRKNTNSLVFSVACSGSLCKCCIWNFLFHRGIAFLLLRDAEEPRNRGNSCDFCDLYCMMKICT